jgi:hypothetical protein
MGFGGIPYFIKWTVCMEAADVSSTQLGMGIIQLLAMRLLVCLRGARQWWWWWSMLEWYAQEMVGMWD